MDKNLTDVALRYMKNAYAPYSGFKVGAAVLADDGRIYGGCNVENASYGLTVCAERVAIFKAISEGARRILKLLVVADTDAPVRPCGACLQVAYEFGGKELTLILKNVGGDTKVVKLEELLALPFGGEDLK